MAKYYKLRVNDGFVRGTEAGVSVTIGTTATLKASIKVHAKTISDVYNQLVTEKTQFSAETWDKIERYHVGGSVSFFYGLFDLMAGASYDYSDRETKTDIQQSKESQAIARAFHDSDTSDVSKLYEDALVNYACAEERSLEANCCMLHITQNQLCHYSNVIIIIVIGGYRRHHSSHWQELCTN